MSSERDTREITLDFIRTPPTSTAPGFPSEQMEYHVRLGDGSGASVSLPWNDATFQEDLEQLAELKPDENALKRLGRRLRELLVPTHWPVEEDEIERRIQSRLPIDIVISSNAPEIYALPWELLELDRTGRRLGSVENCLIRYDWMQAPRHESPLSAADRIVFAWSDGDGAARVPHEAHRKALDEARRQSVLPTPPLLNELPRATRQNLTETLQHSNPSAALLHLLCHGTMTPEGAYGLLLSPQRSHLEPDRINATDFQHLFPAHAPPRLVVLCACQSGDSGAPHLLGNVAQNLHRQDVPVVIASRMPLSVEGSNVFTREFYGELLRGDGNLRTAFLKARGKLRGEQRFKDWLSLQCYARRGNGHAFKPFQHSVPSLTGAAEPRRKLVPIRHEAYTKGGKDPGPALFAGRPVRQPLLIDQTPLLGSRQWENLPAAVQSLAAEDGELRRALKDPEVECLYYGLPYIPLAALVGCLAKRRVHLVDHFREQGAFAWLAAPGEAFPEMHVESRPENGQGSALRLRVSVSFEVRVEDCREVPQDKEVKMDLHFRLDPPRLEVVRSEEQARRYASIIHEHLTGYNRREGPFESVHVFAAVPVSLAFLIGQIFSSTGMPKCYVYNYYPGEKPKYKWRLCLQDAELGKEKSVKIFGRK